MLRVFEYYVAKLIKKLHFSAIKNSDIHNTSKYAAGCHIVNTQIGRYTSIGYDCSIIESSIGSFCSLGSNIRIGGANHPMHWVSSSSVFCAYKDDIKTKFSHHEFSSFLKTHIGNDVWIADNVLIKSGVKIGNGAVVGMGSVITKDVEPYMIVVGNPARVIRKRFDDDIINKLIEIEWWNFDDTQLLKYAEAFNDPVKFIKIVFENK
jgi:acetyltransferase-like isoleucine patch superfamily enzyme